MQRTSLFLTILCLVYSQLSFGHNPTETDSELSMHPNYFSFQIEMPNSLIDAVKKAFPILDRTNSSDTMKAYTEKYLRANIKVWEQKQLLEPVSVLMGDGSHSHSLWVEFRYAARDLSALTVENTVLFNQFSKQKNYHRVTFPDGTIKRFLTNAEQASFSLAAASMTLPTRGFSAWPYLLLGTILVLLIALRIRVYYKERKVTAT